MHHHIAPQFMQLYDPRANEVKYGWRGESANSMCQKELELEIVTLRYARMSNTTREKEYFKAMAMNRFAISRA